MKWITFFSQTGSEIVEVSQQLGRKPDLIIFNGVELPEKIHNLGVYTILLPNRPSIQDYIRVFPADDFLATFHGWLRIVPPEVCKVHKGRLFNGHPGLITRYPELKGKDPQIRAFQGMYPVVGSVVHELTEELDGGAVVTQESTTVTYPTDLTTIFNTLRSTSLKAWLKFFETNKV